MIQTRTAQRKIIEAAMADGTIGTLLWFIVSDRGGGKTHTIGINDWIPVVRVGPDAKETEHYAHLMLEMCRHYTPNLPMHLEITAVDILDDAKMRWFVWGEHDAVCDTCGAVGWESCCCEPTVWIVDEERIDETER